MSDLAIVMNYKGSKKRTNCEYGYWAGNGILHYTFMFQNKIGGYKCLGTKPWTKAIQLLNTIVNFNLLSTHRDWKRI